MTQDEIIEMARQSGFFVKDSEAYSPSVQEDHELTPYLETFAKLVADKEREACANAMARIVMTPTLTHGALVKLSDVVNAIRVRGQA
jgi:hypothetical protein